MWSSTGQAVLQCPRAPVQVPYLLVFDRVGVGVGVRAAVRNPKSNRNPTKDTVCAPCVYLVLVCPAVSYVQIGVCGGLGFGFVQAHT